MSTSRRRLSAAERVELMLSVLPWLAAKGPTPLTEVAEQFGADPDQLRADLETVFYEVEPLPGPDHMVEVDIDPDGGIVSVHLPGSFEEPPRLDHVEALLLLAAGSALAGEPGSDVALAPALEKLTRALGKGAETALQVDLGRGDPAVRAEVRTALAERRRLELTYFAWSSDEVSRRTVDPWAVRSFEGHWYLSGHDHDRGALRHFRLDRVLTARSSGPTGAFDVPGEVEEPEDQLREGGRRVGLRLPPQAAWVVESHPVQRWEDIGNAVHVELRVHSDAWLDRLLVRLGPEATAMDLDTDESLLPRRAAAAERILSRYHRSGVATGDG